jgi:hypothetical protein
MKYHKYSHSRNPNKELAADIDAYGWDAFKIEVLEECTRENVRYRERFYIESLQAVENGYNMTHATKYQDWMKDYNQRMWKDPDYRERKATESRERQLRRLSNPDYLAEKSKQLRIYTDSIKRPVAMYSKNGELLHTFTGIREAERWLIDAGITQSHNASSIISDCCKGGRHKTAYGYVWKYL